MLIDFIYFQHHLFIHKGVEHEKHNNPADFFIDAIIRNEQHMDGTDTSEEDIIQLKSMSLT